MLKFLILVLLTLKFANADIIIGNNDIELLSTVDSTSELYQRSRPTGRVQIPGTLGINDFCTISLISENLAITAAHCFKKVEATRGKAFFDYYDRSTKNLNPYKVVGVKYQDEGLDLTIIELEGKPGLKYGWYKIAQSAPVANEALIIFQHPALAAKSMSRIGCMFLETYKDLFMHACDTENYSSGSPILNEKFEIVAIHQGGFLRNDDLMNYGRLVLHLRQE